MDSFARKLLDELTCRAGELGDELGISGVPSAEIYAEDIVLGDTVEATQNLMKTTAEVVRSIEAYMRSVRVGAETEQAVSKSLSPSSALEELLPSEVSLFWISLASVKVSSSRREENSAVEFALMARKGYTSLKGRFKLGFESYRQQYENLRKEVVRLQRMLHKATNDRDFGDLQARLEAAEPLWRAKGEMLGAEADSLARELTVFNTSLIQDLSRMRSKSLKISLHDMEELWETQISRLGPHSSIAEDN